MQKIQPEAIEAQIASAVEHVGVIAQIRRAAAMADDHALEIDTLRGKDVELFAAHRTVVGMGGDRRAGLEMRTGGGAQALLLVLGDLALGGRALDDSGLDAGAGDSLGQLGDVNVSYLADRALLEVGGVAEVLLVE